MISVKDERSPNNDLDGKKKIKKKEEGGKGAEKGEKREKLTVGNCKRGKKKE